MSQGNVATRVRCARLVVWCALCALATGCAGSCGQAPGDGGTDAQGAGVDTGQDAADPDGGETGDPGPGPEELAELEREALGEGLRMLAAGASHDEVAAMLEGMGANVWRADTLVADDGSQARPVSFDFGYNRYGFGAEARIADPEKIFSIASSFEEFEARLGAGAARVAARNQARQDPGGAGAGGLIAGVIDQGSKKALMLAPMYELEANPTWASDFDRLSSSIETTLSAERTQAGWVVTAKRGSEVTLEEFASIPDYSLVYVDGHGAYELYAPNADGTRSGFIEMSTAEYTVPEIYTNASWLDALGVDDALAREQARELCPEMLEAVRTKYPTLASRDEARGIDYTLGVSCSTAPYTVDTGIERAIVYVATLYVSPFFIGYASGGSRVDRGLVIFNACSIGKDIPNASLDDMLTERVAVLAWDEVALTRDSGTQLAELVDELANGLSVTDTLRRNPKSHLNRKTNDDGTPQQTTLRVGGVGPDGMPSERIRLVNALYYAIVEFKDLGRRRVAAALRLRGFNEVLDDPADWTIGLYGERTQTEDGSYVYDHPVLEGGQVSLADMRAQPDPNEGPGYWVVNLEGTLPPGAPPFKESLVLPNARETYLLIEKPDEEPEHVLLFGFDNPEQLAHIDCASRACCASRGDGQGVTCWGASSTGRQLPPPEAVDEPRLLDGPRGYPCALDASRRPVCWADAPAWTRQVPEQMPELIDFAVGETMICGLSYQGTLHCYGPGGEGLERFPRQGFYGRVTLGRQMGCVTRTSDGHPVCWGDAADSLIYTQNARYVPAPQVRALDIAAGTTLVCGALAGQGIDCFGNLSDTGAFPNPGPVWDRQSRPPELVWPGAEYLLLLTGTTLWQLPYGGQAIEFDVTPGRRFRSADGSLNAICALETQNATGETFVRCEGDPSNPMVSQAPEKL